MGNRDAKYDLLSGKFFGGGDADDRLAAPTSVSRARYTGMSRQGYIIAPDGGVLAKLIRNARSFSFCS